MGYLILAGAQLIGGYQQANLIEQSAGVQQSINNMNARFQELDAFNALKSGITASNRFSSETDAVVGSQRGTMAAAGQDVNFGTASRVQADSKIAGMVNALAVQKAGRQQALGYNMEAIQTRLKGSMGVAQGAMDAGAAENKGLISAIGTGVSGYTQSQSAGPGQGSKSSSLSTPTWSGATSAYASSYTDATSPGGYGEKPAWFYGNNPSGQSQPSSGSLFSSSSWNYLNN